MQLLIYSANYYQQPTLSGFKSQNFFVYLKFVHHKSGAEWREIKRQLCFKIFNANFAVEKYTTNSKIFLLCSGFVGKIIVSKISWWDLKTKQN